MFAQADMVDADGRQWSKAGWWILLAVVVFVRGLISVLFAWGDYLQKSDAELPELPGLLPIYARHLVSLISKPRKFGPRSRLQPLSLTVNKGVSPRLQQLIDFQRLCQPGVQHHPTHLPLVFLTVQTFGLQLACLANAKYPLSAIGSVMTGYRALLLREYESSSPLTFRVRLNDDFRVTAAGNVEFESVCEAKDAETGELIWTDVTSFMAKVAKPLPAVQHNSKPDDPDTSSWPHRVSWRWSTQAGPQFGRLNGDINPIHMRPWLAKLFGFRSNIAHGQHVVARAVNAIDLQGVQPTRYPRAVSASFRRPTVLPSEVCCSWQAGQDEQVLSFGLADSAVRFRLLKPVDFTVAAQPSAKALVVGCLGTVLMERE